jgi:hypothetical protein
LSIYYLILKYEFFLHFHTIEFVASNEYKVYENSMFNFTQQSRTPTYILFAFLIFRRKYDYLNESVRHLSSDKAKFRPVHTLFDKDFLIY